jgi:hypothetical protein
VCFRENEHRAGPEIGAPIVLGGWKQKLPVMPVFVMNHGWKQASTD